MSERSGPQERSAASVCILAATTLRCACYVTGGSRAGERGYFVRPTVVKDVKPNMSIVSEEIFGPVVVAEPFTKAEELIPRANQTPYGLAAGVWTSSIKRAIRASERLEAGTVWVNTYRAVSYMSPFGGYKNSGFGRENGQHAIDEYLQTKSVWINSALETPNPFSIR